jgi:hypothetical protein
MRFRGIKCHNPKKEHTRSRMLLLFVMAISGVQAGRRRTKKRLPSRREGAFGAGGGRRRYLLNAALSPSAAN